MRIAGCLVIVLLLGAIAPAAADYKSDTHPYAALCKALSFKRRGPGTLSDAMRSAEIQRCMKNRGVLD
jgi:hypothetical protein